MRLQIVAVALLTFLACEPQVARPTEQLALPERPAPADIGATVFIEGGEFVMGAAEGAEKAPNAPGDPWWGLARPAHKEKVPSFEIGKYEVTAGAFCEFLNELEARGEDTSAYLIMDRQSTVQPDTAGPPRRYRCTEGYEHVRGG